MSTQAQPKAPGRMKTMWQVFQMTRKFDKAALPLVLLALLLPIAIITILAIVLLDHWFFILLWILTGVLFGVLLAMIVLSRRAERVALQQIEGQPGAVGRVLASNLRGSWQASEMPVGINAKTHDAIYRAVGKPGVVLVTEGDAQRTKKLVADEQRKIKRVLPNVPVHVVHVGPGSEVTLRSLGRTLRRLPNDLTKAQVLQISHRLNSMGAMNVPIPKGVDPRKVRAGRPR